MARKMKLTELIGLYKLATGEDAEVVADDYTPADGEAGYNPDEIIQLIDSSRSPIISQKMRAEMEQELNKTISGKFSSAQSKALSEATGIPISELKDKNAKEATALAFAHYAKTMNMSNEAAAQQIREISEKHTQEREAWENEKKQLIDAHSKDMSEFSISQILRGMYDGSKHIDPNADKSFLQDNFRTWLDKNYDVRLSDDKKEIRLYDKSNPGKQATNDAGTMMLKLEDVMQSYHTRAGNWKSDTSHVDPAKHLPVTNKPNERGTWDVDRTNNRDNDNVRARMQQMVGAAAQPGAGLGV